MWNDIKHLVDNNVTKIVYTKDDAVAESVLYRYPDYLTRTVICCSVQSGCPVGCRFCGSGDYFVRNLTTDEIIYQIEYSLGQTGVDPLQINKLQIMTMSMGEPLLNIKNLLPALDHISKKYPNAALLVSTTAPDIGAGWDQVFEFARTHEMFGLQFSIHETTDQKRNELIPFKAKLSLAEIARKGDMFFQVTGRKPYINYCAHNENSSWGDANRLCAYFDPRVFCATVSVVCERTEGIAASNDHQRGLASDFASKLVAREFDVRMFDPSGQDTVGGGCGQLHYVQQWFKDNPTKARPSCGNGKAVVHTPIKL